MEATAPTLDDANRLANRREQSSDGYRRRIARLLALGWLVSLTWWLAENYSRLRIAKVLIKREEVAQGVPITADDHLSALPGLSAEFEALGLIGNTDMVWVLALAAFFVVGVAIAVGLLLAEARPTSGLPAAMAVVWSAGVALAIANAETLSLLGWLNN